MWAHLESPTCSKDNKSTSPFDRRSTRLRCPLPKFMNQLLSSDCYNLDYKILFYLPNTAPYKRQITVTIKPESYTTGPDYKLQIHKRLFTLL